jgi:hypothetical protein
VLPQFISSDCGVAHKLKHCLARRTRIADVSQELRVVGDVAVRPGGWGSHQARVYQAQVRRVLHRPAVDVSVKG